MVSFFNEESGWGITATSRLIERHAGLNRQERYRDNAPFGPEFDIEHPDSLDGLLKPG